MYLMKKILLTLFITLICIFTLSACDINPQQPDNSHVHNFGEWETVKEATCTISGEEERSCTCGKKETKRIDAFGYHKFGGWSITKYATNSEEGERVHTCSVCNVSEYDVIDIIRYDGSLGSAGKISDTTVIVPIFANDSGTSWDFNSVEDTQTINILHERLSSAVSWLENNCKDYNADTTFIYDWKTNPDLIYTFDFPNINMVRADGGGYYTQREYIQNHINSEDIKQRYNAQNIIYILYFNVDETNTVNSWSLSYKPDREVVDVEVINIFARSIAGGESYIKSAATFAHEILHCFGAYDLYYSSAAIPQEYVDYCKQTNSKDIMYATNLGKEIKMTFTVLCAYYVGLVDNCSEVEDWNLAKSMHITS